MAHALFHYFQIGKPDSKGDPKPIIWVDSAIHAREWLTVGTTIWIINKVNTLLNAGTIYSIY